MNVLSSLRAFALVAAFAACSSDSVTAPRTDAPLVPPAENNAGGNKFITVMTRNVYLGASLDPVIGAPSPQLIPIRVADVWAQVQATNFAERAKALADEIAAAEPELVGLQEVALWRTQFPGDAHTGGVPATEVAQDFLAMLLDELSARGQKYVVASSVNNFDAELFMFTGTPGASLTRDIRLTDRDVVLAKHNLVTWNPQGAHYAVNAALNVGGPGGPPVVIARGWTSVDARFHGVNFRFFNTHLEVDSPPFAAVQVAQGNEVVSLLAASPFPVIAVGDYNSPVDGATTTTYATLQAAGLSDVWPLVNASAPGFTFGTGPDLLGPTSLFAKRIDLVMFRGAMEASSASVVGDSDADRTPSGMMPSDHAGVVATIRLGVR